MNGLVVMGIGYVVLVVSLVKKITGEGNGIFFGIRKHWLISASLSLLLIPIVLISLLIGLAVTYYTSPFIVFSAGCVFGANGLVMFKRESRSLGNSLSLLLGVGLLGVSLSSFAAYKLGLKAFQPMIHFANSLCVGFLFVFLVFLIVAFFSQRGNNLKPVDFIVILGSGLVNDKVPPLLKSRLTQGIHLFKQQQAQGIPSKFVVTGGKGIDEGVSEACAMKEYLLTQGIAPSFIIVEDKAVNTFENMRFSKRLMDKEKPSYSSIFVSNNFHVLRSSWIAKKEGLCIKGVGSYTASYYLPSAMLREFVAVTVIWSGGLRESKVSKKTVSI